MMTERISKSDLKKELMWTSIHYLEERVIEDFPELAEHIEPILQASQP
tara:strand:- start:16933 stop:17076 length:144 start_codon:yes stop_codon:yes gene_type:complete